MKLSLLRAFNNQVLPWNLHFQNLSVPMLGRLGLAMFQVRQLEKSTKLGHRKGPRIAGNPECFGVGHLWVVYHAG